jgi:hypothetical protein
MLPTPASTFAKAGPAWARIRINPVSVASGDSTAMSSNSSELTIRGGVAADYASSDPATTTFHPINIEEAHAGDSNPFGGVLGWLVEY